MLIRNQKVVAQEFRRREDRFTNRKPGAFIVQRVTTVMSWQRNISCYRFKNALRCLFCASLLWAVLIVIVFCIGHKASFKRKIVDQSWQSTHLKYTQLQSRKQAFRNSMAGVLKTRRLKHRRLLPLEVMFANAGEKDKEKEKLSQWNSVSVPLTDLRVKTNKPEVLLLVIVSSAPTRQDRRNAIRKTWWKSCNGKARCVFFTDGLQLKEQKLKLLKEVKSFKDINLSPIESDAMIFGERFLYQIVWAKAKFKFQYLLRLDDDYFVCIERLLNELHSRPKKLLSWGSYHCHDENLVYMDESWALFSEDVIEKFLAQDLRSMLCHPFGDQTFTLWINATGVNLTDFDDNRLHYWPPASKLNEFFSKTDVCEEFMGVHGSYPDLMQYLWRNSNDGPKNITELTLLNTTCYLPKVFDVNKFSGIYKYKPKLCLEKARWVSMLKSWQGNENNFQLR